MKTTTLLALLLSLTSLGCECGPPIEPGPDAPLDAPVTADAPGPMDAPVESDASPDAPSSDTPSSDTASTDAPSGVTVAIADFSIFGNCMPIVPPDPIIATWTITVSGATGATARFVTGTLTFSGGASQTITVEDDTIDLVAGAGTGDQRRAGGTPAIPGCGTICSAGEDAALQVTYEVDGATYQVDASGAYSCAF